MTRIEFEAEKRSKISGYLWRPLVMNGLRECYIISEKREVYNFLRCRLLKPIDAGSVKLCFADGLHARSLDVLMVQAFPERFSDAPGEVWRTVLWNGEPSSYEVSNLGAFRRRENKRPIKPDVSGGYCGVRLRAGGHAVQHALLARLVAQAFVENPHEYHFVRHKDGNPMNNAADNLEWRRASRNYKKGT